MMTRDDVLRELELLPVWQLRVPVAAVQTEPAQIAASEKLAPEILTVKKLEITQNFQITISQDNHWAFACENNMPADRMDAGSQSMLFDNILKALHIDKTFTTQNLAEVNAKVIVAFGENVAQKLLSSQEKLENLQGKLHAIGAAKVIASDDLAHLIAHPQDKAKLWQDLCLARTYLAD